MKLNVLSPFLILLFFIVSSCSKDDSFEKLSSSINGDWYLKSYEHSTNGENINFIKNDIIWNFNEDLNKLTIKLNISALTLENYESIYIGVNEGIYDYSIIEKNEISYLIIGDDEFGNISFSTNELKVNRKEAPYDEGNNLSTWNFEN